MTIDGGLNKIFRTHLPKVHWVRIESPLTGGGIPDMNGCYQASEFWIEFKQTKAKKVGIRTDQVGWLLRRARAGGRVFIAVREQGRHDALHLFSGAKAADVLRDGILAPALIRCPGNPPQWDWSRIMAILTA